MKSHKVATMSMLHPQANRIYTCLYQFMTFVHFIALVLSGLYIYIHIYVPILLHNNNLKSYFTVQLPKSLKRGIVSKRCQFFHNLQENQHFSAVRCRFNRTKAPQRSDLDIASASAASRARPQRWPEGQGAPNHVSSRHF